MSLNALTLLAAESSESAGISPYLVGGLVLAFLLSLLLALVSVGGGREHS